MKVTSINPVKFTLPYPIFKGMWELRFLWPLHIFALPIYYENNSITNFGVVFENILAN